MGSRSSRPTYEYAVQPSANLEPAFASSVEKEVATLALKHSWAAARRDGRNPPPLDRLKEELDVCQEQFISFREAADCFHSTGLAAIRWGRLGTQLCCFATVWLPVDDAHYQALVAILRRQCRKRVRWETNYLKTYAIFLRIEDGRDILVPD